MVCPLNLVQSYGSQIVLSAIFISFGLLHLDSREAQACAKHPGMTHEQWTSSMANEAAKFQAKNPADRGFSNDFWSRKVAPSNGAKAAPSDGSPVAPERENSSDANAPRERGIREVPAN